MLTIFCLFKSNLYIIIDNDNHYHLKFNNKYKKKYEKYHTLKSNNSFLFA